MFMSLSPFYGLCLRLQAVIIFITGERVVVLGFTLFVFCIRFSGVMELNVISILNALRCSENNEITSKWKCSSKIVFLVLLIGLLREEAH